MNYNLSFYVTMYYGYANEHHCKQGAHEVQFIYV